MQVLEYHRSIENKYEMQKLEVVSMKYNELNKVIIFNNGEQIILPISACVTEKDQLLRKGYNFYVLCRNGLSKIYPSYKEAETVVLGKKRLNILVKEIENSKEDDAQRYLSEFHYRNGRTFGRRCKLIIKSHEKNTPLVIGYIELSIAPLANKARNTVLNSGYDDGTIKWNEWDFEARGKYSKCIVNIARVVVHPDFRGIKLSKILLKHAFLFAKNHWQISGLKPLFVEITADMLKFLPFAEKCGMFYIGDTKGNINRVNRDLKHSLKQRGKYTNPNNKSSLIRMQSRYLKYLLKTCEENKINEFELINELSALDENSIRDKYPLMYGLLRFPKPTFMFGLTNYSHRFLQKVIEELDLRPKNYEFGIKINPIKSPFVLSGISLEVDSKVNESERSRIVQESFGIHEENLKTTILKNFDLKIEGGDIILISGSSGSGKTSLLNVICGQLKPIKGQVKKPKGLKLGILKPLESREPLIDIIGETINESLYALNKAGLSEPKLYLRRFSELSKGQQYRAMIAKLIASKNNVWVADEFLTSLDDITANIVATNIRRFVKRFGITLIAANSNCDNFVDSLKPDKIIFKSIGHKHTILKPQLT